MINNLSILQQNSFKMCPCPLSSYCKTIFSSFSISQKGIAILQLTDSYFDYHSKRWKYGIDNDCCEKMRSLLCSFRKMKKPIPRSNGQWSGEPGNSVFNFYTDFQPKNETRTRNEMDWGKLINEYSNDFHFKDHGIRTDGGISYSNFRINLSEYAIASVKIKYENTNLTRGGSSNTIQEIGAKEFEQQNNIKDMISNGGYADFWRFKDGIIDGDFSRNTPLLIHEDYDCESLLLVPKFLHDNWKHYGGISIVKLLRKERLI